MLLEQAICPNPAYSPNILQKKVTVTEYFDFPITIPWPSTPRIVVGLITALAVP